MRNITKFKRSVRAISPVISALILIAIAVIAALIAYAWITGFMGNQTGNTDNSIEIQNYSFNQNLTIYVKNTGQDILNLKQDSSVYVNDVIYNIGEVDDSGLDTGDLFPISAGQTVKVEVDYYNYKIGDRIKVVTFEGPWTEIITPATPGTSPSTTAAPGQSPTTTDTQPTNTPVTTTEPLQTSNKLAFVAGAPQSLLVGEASAKITIQRQNSAGTPIVDGATTIVTLDPAAGTYYSDSVCTNAITGPVTIASDASTVDFYYKCSAEGGQKLTAQASNYQQATTTFTIYTVTPPTYTVEYRVNNDAYGIVNPSGTISSYVYGNQVTIIATPKSGYIFTSWTRSSDINIADTSASQTTATILGDGTITANFQAQSTDKLVFTEGTNQYIELNAVSARITVQRQSSSGTPITTDTLTLSLTSISSGGKFYKNAACTQQITESSPLTINSGSSTAYFYYKDSSTGTPTISVSANSALVQTTFNVNTRSTGFDGDNWLYGFTVGSQPPWYVASDEGVDGTNCAKSDPYGINSGAFTANSLDTSQANTITISFMYKTANIDENDDFQIFYSVNANPNLYQDSPDFNRIASLSASSTWTTYTATFTRASNSDMFDPTFWFRFQSDLEFGSDGAVEAVWVDNLVISVA